MALFSSWSFSRTDSDMGPIYRRVVQRGGSRCRSHLHGLVVPSLLKPQLAIPSSWPLAYRVGSELRAALSSWPTHPILRIQDHPPLVPWCEPASSRRCRGRAQVKDEELRPEEVKEVKVYRLAGTLSVEAELLGDGNEAVVSHLPGPGSLRNNSSPKDGMIRCVLVNLW